MAKQAAPKIICQKVMFSSTRPRRCSRCAPRHMRQLGCLLVWPQSNRVRRGPGPLARAEYWHNAPGPGDSGALKTHCLLRQTEQFCRVPP